MKKLFLGLSSIIFVLAVIYFSSPFALNGLARFLVVSDKLTPADAILVLAGDANGERVAAGVNLYKHGYAKYLLMSGGQMAWRLTYAEWMKKQAEFEKVPASAILLQAKSRSTFEDAKFSLPIILAHNFKSVILVTSPYHTRRAAAVFKKLYVPAGVKVFVYPVEKSSFNPDGWWTRHGDTSLVVREYVASVLYFFKGD